MIEVILVCETESMALSINGQYVGDQIFLQAFLELAEGRTPSQVRAASPTECDTLQRAAEERVLHFTLLHQMALQEGTRPSPQEVESERRRRWGSSANQTCGIGVQNRIESELMVERLRQHLTRHIPRPSRLEVEEYYASHRTQFHLPERVLAAHIVCLVESPSQQKAALEKLNQAELELGRGRAFGAVADRYSDCRGSGGQLGWITRGEMIEEFESAVFDLKKGERSGIFSTVFGLHIAMKHDARPAGIQAFEEIRSDLARSLHENRRQSAINQIMAQAIRQSSIQIVEGSDRTVAEGEKTR